MLVATLAITFWGLVVAVDWTAQLLVAIGTWLFATVAALLRAIIAVIDWTVQTLFAMIALLVTDPFLH